MPPPSASHRLDMMLKSMPSSEQVIMLMGKLADSLLKFLSERMPVVEEWLLEGLDTIFAPRLLLRHLIASMVLQAGLIGWKTLVSAAQRLMSQLNAKHRDIEMVKVQLNSADTFDDWKKWAERLDELEGHDVWRRVPDCLLYDHEKLQSEIDDINALLSSGDAFSLIFEFRGGLSRNTHGMLHEGLFSRAHAGTKILVENYHKAVCEALHFIATTNTDMDHIPADAKLAFFNETRHAYGRTALLLSGGAAMGFYHVGVVKSLLENCLLPRVISGASAGSIVAAMVGTRTDHELKPMFEGNDLVLEFFRTMSETKRQRAKLAGTDKFKSEAFWQLMMPPQLRWLGDLVWSLLFQTDGLLSMDTDYFRGVMRHNIGTYTFQEAFDRTGRIVNITVAPRNRTDPPRLLNYLTAPHVLVWSAAVCSSSVPGVFQPSTLYVKEADGSVRPESVSTKEMFVDGSMEADLPMQQLSELFNINHFIVSQVNPHASLLSTMSLHKSVWNHPVYSMLVGMVSFLRAQVRNWFRNVIEFVSNRRMAPLWATRRGGIQLLTQEYEGRHIDVTITPWEGHESIMSSFTKMLTNPTRETFKQMVRVSERNTWPKIEIIRSHCAVEVALERCVQYMRKQVTLENSRLSQGMNTQGGRQQGQGFGRVPSFYTSRSIVGLSGLNVTDPTFVAPTTMGSGGGGSTDSPTTSVLALAGDDDVISEEEGDGDDGEDGDGGGGDSYGAFADKESSYEDQQPNSSNHILNDLELTVDMSAPFLVPLNEREGGGGNKYVKKQEERALALAAANRVANSIANHSNHNIAGGMNISGGGGSGGGGGKPLSPSPVNALDISSLSPSLMATASSMDDLGQFANHYGLTLSDHGPNMGPGGSGSGPIIVPGGGGSGSLVVPGARSGSLTPKRGFQADIGQVSSMLSPPIPLHQPVVNAALEEELPGLGVGNVTKSTSMANFYYRRSKSFDQMESSSSNNKDEIGASGTGAGNLSMQRRKDSGGFSHGNLSSMAGMSSPKFSSSPMRAAAVGNNGGGVGGGGGAAAGLGGSGPISLAGGFNSPTRVNRGSAMHSPSRLQRGHQFNSNNFSSGLNMGGGVGAGGQGDDESGGLGNRKRGDGGSSSGSSLNINNNSTHSTISTNSNSSGSYVSNSGRQQQPRRGNKPRSDSAV